MTTQAPAARARRGFSRARMRRFVLHAAATVGLLVLVQTIAGEPDADSSCFAERAWWERVCREQRRPDQVGDWCVLLGNEQHRRCMDRALVERAGAYVIPDQHEHYVPVPRRPKPRRHSSSHPTQ